MSDTQNTPNVTDGLPVLLIGKSDPLYKHAPCAVVVKGSGYNIYVREDNRMEDLGQIVKYAPFQDPPEGVDIILWKAHRKDEQEQLEKTR